MIQMQPFQSEAAPLLGQPERKSKLDLAHVLGALPMLAFVICVIYALAVSNTDAVQQACGKQLWQFTLAHLIVPLGLSFVIIIGTVGVMACCIGFSPEAESFMPVVFAIVASVVVVSYSSLFLGFGVPIVHSAMSSQRCVDALSDASGTRSAMLGILACIYLVFDGLLLLALACVLLFVSCLTPSRSGLQ
jgi:hypothetical protein